MKHLLNRLKPLKQLSPLEALHLKVFVNQLVRQNTRPGEGAPFSAGHHGRDKKACLAAGTFWVRSFQPFTPFIGIFLLLVLTGLPRFYAHPAFPGDKTIASKLPQTQVPDLPLLLHVNPSPGPERQVQKGITYRLRPLKGRLVAATIIYPIKPSNILTFDFTIQLQAQDLYYLKLGGTTVQKVLSILRE